MKTSTFQKDSTLWITGFLCLTLFFVYMQVLRHDFLTYDDHLYVTGNDVVLQGLTLDGVLWAFTAIEPSNWHPLTMISHMIDVEVFGLNPGPHHLVSVLFHIANALLVFVVLSRMTGTVWRAAFVAALFALHPLRVESVAWAAERKDVLSMFFWLLGMLAYARYVEQRTLGRYLLLVGMFVLALMSKPMVVTFPFALLLLDVWPLNRLGDPGEEGIAARIRPLIVEKIPLFALAGAGAFIAYYTQQQTEAMAGTDLYPLGSRLANAVHSYGMYLWNTVYPLNLGLIYPHPGGGIPMSQIVFASVVFWAITVVVLFALRTHPYLGVGWFWFLGTLVPVIGLVQVGMAARADRYTYLPHLGLFIALVWGVSALAERWPALKRPVVALGLSVVLVLTALSFVQTSRWRNNVTMFSHTVRVSPDSPKAHFALGVGYVARGNFIRGEEHFRRSLDLEPADVATRKNLGATLIDLGRPEEAADYLLEVVRMASYDPENHVTLAIALYRQQKYGEAMFRAEEALRIDPDYTRAWEVIDQCGKALKPDIPLDP